MSEYTEEDRLQDRLGANKMAYEMEVEYSDTKAMLLKHEQQIKDLAAHLLELRKWGTPMMEFKREKPTTMGMEYAANFEQAEKLLEKKEWVGLTDDEIKAIIGHNHPEGIGSYARELFKQIEAKLREKNCG